MVRLLNVGTSILASLARFGSGGKVGNPGARPEKMLELYEFENCPFCRKAREALSILDLDALIYPCPKSGPRYRPELVERGGKAQFPYLVDPNTGTELYESNDVVRYLFEHYGDGHVPILLKPGPQNDLTAMLASMVRPFLRGRFYTSARPPEEALELFSYEASPFCRIVRDVLCSLEIPYIVRNVAKGSSKRAEFTRRTGKMRVPFLVDPNTGTEMFESADIVAYLEQTYGAKESSG